MQSKHKTLSKPALAIVAARFRALADESRLQLLQLLFEGERSVQELCELSGLGQANVSKHLAILAEQGILERRRQGLFMFYRIGDDSIYELCNLVCGSVGKRYGQVMKEFSGE
jgi:DNA-binding transcriptional ArsR family regulator